MTLLKLIDHDVKQCRLNSCAALYAISCAGRPICREIAEKQPMHKLVALVCPGVGRTSQDDQLQLFAALLVVNLLHVRGAVKTKPERETLSETLQRAYDDSTDQQVRLDDPARRQETQEGRNAESEAEGGRPRRRLHARAEDDGRGGRRAQIQAGRARERLRRQRRELRERRHPGRLRRRRLRRRRRRRLRRPDAQTAAAARGGSRFRASGAAARRRRSRAAAAAAARCRRRCRRCRRCRCRSRSCHPWGRSGGRRSSRSRPTGNEMELVRCGRGYRVGVFISVGVPPKTSCLV